MDKQQLTDRAREYKQSGLSIYAFIHDFNSLLGGWTQTRELGAIFVAA